MRWSRLFADLDAQVEAAERAERAAESAELRRLEVSRVDFAQRLAGAVGSAVTLWVHGVDPLTGRLTQVGADWLLLDCSSSGEMLVPVGAVISVSGLPAGSAVLTDEIDRRLGIGAALRRLARDRVTITAVLRTGAAVSGTIDRVGADFVDLAEHPADQPRRATEVQRVRTFPFEALAVVRPA